MHSWRVSSIRYAGWPDRQFVLSRSSRGACRQLLATRGLENAILNLVANARDAMPGGGCLRVAVCRGDDEHDSARTAATGCVRGHIIGDPFMVGRAASARGGILGLTRRLRPTVRFADSPVLRGRIHYRKLGPTPHASGTLLPLSA